MHRYQIVPHDGQGKQTGTDDLEKAIRIAARRAASDKKPWHICWQGGILMTCNEFAEQTITKIRMDGQRCAHV